MGKPCTIKVEIDRDWQASNWKDTPAGGSVTIDILSLSIVNDCIKPSVKWNTFKETEYWMICSLIMTMISASRGCKDISGTGKVKVKCEVTDYQLNVTLLNYVTGGSILAFFAV